MKLEVKGYHHGYAIHIDNGQLDRLEAVMDPSVPSVLITDDGVPKSYVDSVHAQMSIALSITLSAGEQSKSFDTYHAIVLKMQKAGISRHARIIALGGGMVSDIAGFAAATYKRGIPFTIIATTLLSMVDASIGGKVAINTPFAKNSVGSFHTPDAVIIDPDTLKTLPKRHLNNGMAEVIKSALIADATLFHHLNTPFEALNLPYVIESSLKIKRSIVEEDPLDKGLRGLLNYGHTIGHAIEGESDYHYLHGECVAMGMRMMARGRPFENILKTMLDHHGLTQSMTFDPEALMRRIREDKKVSGDHIEIADVERAGNGFMKRTNFLEIERILKGGTPS